MISRQIAPKVQEEFFLGKVLIVYGARQVGKTTLVKSIFSEFTGPKIFLNADEPDVAASLYNKTSTELENLIGEAKLVVIDEAQRVKNIGLTLKLLIDTFPDRQFIATGSSAFALANQVNEPLTGRNLKHFLYPLSEMEIREVEDSQSVRRNLETRLIYGSYPDVVIRSENRLREKLISNITNDYLFKDLLTYQKIKNPMALRKLLQELALKIGKEVSYGELATEVGVDKNTIIQYIDLLEKIFVIFILNPLSRNLRKELGKMRKIYFYDLGMRNSLINNFNSLDLRTDRDVMWENYVLTERMKRNSHLDRSVNMYFWRTYDQKEIDYVEEEAGKMSGYQIEWDGEKYKTHKDFLGAYPDSTIELVNKTNYEGFLRE